MKNSTTKKIARPREGKIIAGVCLALANYFGVDVTIIRIIFVFLLLPGGLPGFLPYILLWVLIPEEK
jgi:phage shock protein C